MTRPSDFPAEIVAIRCKLSLKRLSKFGPMPPDGPEGKALWLRQMDECAAELGLANVYRTHPYRGKFSGGTPASLRPAAE